MVDKTLRSHIKKCGDLKAQIDALTALFNTEKKVITDELNAREIKDFTAGDYKVLFTEFIQHRLNSKALKSEYPALCEQFSDDVVSNRFTVSRV